MSTGRMLLALMPIWGLMAAFCSLMPHVADDYVFLSRMPRFADILPAALHQYQIWDGRFAGYLLGFTVLKIPHALYVITAASLFCGLVLTVFVAAFGRGWRAHLTPSALWFVAALLWMSVPAFGSVFLWKTGLYYGAAALAAFWVMMPYRFMADFDDYPCLRSPLVMVAYGLLAFFTAMADYLLPILLCLFTVTATSWMLFVEKRRPAERLICLVGLACLLAGGAVTFMSPGNAQRVVLSETSFLALPYLERVSIVLTTYKLLYPCLLIPLALLILCLGSRFRQGGLAALQKLPLWAGIYALTALAGQTAYLFAPPTPTRAYTFIALLWIVAIWAIQAQVKPSLSPREAKWRKGLFACVAVYALVMVPLELYRFWQVHAATQTRLALLENAGGKAVCLPPLPVQGNRHMVAGGDLDDIPINPNHWINQSLAKLWNVPSVTLCAPENAHRFYAAQNNALTVQAQFATAILNVNTSENARPAFIKLLYPSRRLANLNPEALAFTTKHLIRPDGVRRYLLPLFYRNRTIPLTWDERTGTATGPFNLFPFPPENLPLFTLPPGEDGGYNFTVLQPDTKKAGVAPR